MLLKAIPLFVLLLGVNLIAFSQEPQTYSQANNLKCEIIDIRSDTLYLESFSGKIDKDRLQRINEFLKSDLVIKVKNSNTSEIDSKIRESLVNLGISLRKIYFAKGYGEFSTSLYFTTIKPLIEIQAIIERDLAHQGCVNLIK